MTNKCNFKKRTQSQTGALAVQVCANPQFLSQIEIQILGMFFYIITDLLLYAFKKITLFIFLLTKYHVRNGSSLQNKALLN